MSKDMEIHSKNIQALKNYIDNPNSESSLKIDLLRWMWDNIGNINTSDLASNKKKFNDEMQIFLQLIQSK